MGVRARGLSLLKVCSRSSTLTLTPIVLNKKACILQERKLRQAKVWLPQNHMFSIVVSGHMTQPEGSADGDQRRTCTARVGPVLQNTSHSREPTFQNMHTMPGPPGWDNPHDFVSVCNEKFLFLWKIPWKQVINVLNV